MTNRRFFLKRTLAGGAALLASPALPVLARSADATGDQLPDNADSRIGDPWAVANNIAARIRPPAIPDRDFRLTDFGARENTDCSQAFARAIAACHGAGGGRIEIPAGIFLTGPIRLESHVELHLAEGATVRFLSDARAYLPLVPTRWEGVELMNYKPLIYAYDAENLAVTGKGTFDGGADDAHWWPWNGSKRFGWKPGMPSQREARRKLFEMGEKDVPVSQRVFGEGACLRPGFFEPARCRNVMIEGVTLMRMPFWQVHPVLCRNVIVRGLTINGAGGPNTDGCDPECCRDVLIENCSFDTGDDCIAIKSGRNGDGRRVNVPTSNILIRNCRMKDGHGAITIGSEISGGVHHVFAENCAMSSSSLGYAIRVKNNAQRGGRLEHFYFRRIAIGKVAEAAVTVDFNYEEGANGAFTPVLNDMRVESLVCDSCRRAFDLQGLPNAPVKDILLENCEIAHAAEPNVIENVNRLSFRQVRINGKPVAFPE